MSEPTSQELLERYQAGDSEAATAIFDRYVQRLIALARKRISPKLGRRVDPDDVVQSAYRSFFVQARGGKFQLSQPGDLWRRLARSTLNKLYGQVEKHTAGKRAINREELHDLDDANRATRDPTVAEVVAIGEQLRLILEGLSPDEHVVLVSTLQGQGTKEISQSIGKSERTVRRLLAQSRRQFEDRLLGPEPSKASVPIAAPEIPDLQAPLRFSDYVLEQLIGSGGMGRVYRSTEKSTGKTMAVKALHKSRQADGRAVSQFVQESHILSTLRHPNIVGVEGLGRFPGGGYFIVMDFIDGIDLQSRLEAGPLAIVPLMRLGMIMAGPRSS